MSGERGSRGHVRLLAGGLAVGTAAVALLWAVNLVDYDYIKTSLLAHQPPACPSTAGQSLQLPSVKGLNYGTPTAISGEWLGTRWLQSDNWPETRPSFEADLTFIDQNDLGRVLRVFVGLDQLMNWDSKQGYVGFDSARLDHFQESLDMVAAHNMKAIVVVYDQEETSSEGNFHYQALDGKHDPMRHGYLLATETFMRRFGSSPSVAGWDLFNEPYNSLGKDGHLPRPGTADNPVSPNYSRLVVHDWMRDLYKAAKCAAPNAWFTFSDTTDLYWHSQPDVTKYEDSVDFFDIHVYDDHPQIRNWKETLRKPYLIGEVGAGVDGNHFDDQRINPGVVSFFLGHAHSAGLSAVLAHSDGGNVFSRKNGLTATGRVVAGYH